MNHESENRAARATSAGVKEEARDLLKANQALEAETALRRRAEDELRKSEERFRNLTRQLEDQLIISDPLLSLGELAASVAHELNNPLAVILGFAQDLLSELKPSDPHYPAIRIIDEEARRCKKIIQDLLDFVRPAEAAFARVDLAAMVRSSLNVISLPHEPAVKVSLDIEPDLPPVYADPHQIERVLLNVYANALEAMPAGGELRVRVRTRPRASAKREEAAFSGEAVIEVADTGAGIDPADLSKIFRPFFTTKKKKGMGLGLSICKRIMAAHGGRIEAESLRGRGTTFFIHLPIGAR